MVQATLCNCSELDAEQTAVTEEIAVVSELIRHCIDENSSKVQKQAEYLERHDRHIKRYEKLKKKFETIEVERQRRKEQYDRLAGFMVLLNKQGQTPIEFSEELWLATVDTMTVNAEESVIFKLKGGMEIAEQL